jgi:hypothetical protein
MLTTAIDADQGKIHSIADLAIGPDIHPSVGCAERSNLIGKTTVSTHGGNVSTERLKSIRPAADPAENTRLIRGTASVGLSPVWMIMLIISVDCFVHNSP